MGWRGWGARGAKRRWRHQGRAGENLSACVAWVSVAVVHQVLVAALVGCDLVVLALGHQLVRGIASSQALLRLGGYRRKLDAARSLHLRRGVGEVDDLRV